MGVPPQPTPNTVAAWSLLLQREYKDLTSLLRVNLISLFNFLISISYNIVKMAVSKIGQNYHEECEALLNKQINMEFYASYVYLSMASYFARDDIALNGFAEHFRRVRRGERPRDQADGLPEQPRREGRLPGHRQAQLHGVGVPPRGHGGRPRAGEDRQPEPDRHPQGCGRQG